MTPAIPPASAPYSDEGVTLWRETIPYTGSYFWPVKPTPAAGDSTEGRWLALPAYQRLVAERDAARALLKRVAAGQWEHRCPDMVGGCTAVPVSTVSDIEDFLDRLAATGTTNRGEAT